MMDWKKRINMCKTLLSDIREMIPEENTEARESVSTTLQGILDYTDSEAFTENREDEKEVDSWNILDTTIDECSGQMQVIMDKLFPHPPKFITKEEAYRKLLEEYSQGIEEGDETVAAMNINDWIAENRYVLVEEGDKRLCSSSSDDGTVNSRTEF